MAAGAVVNNAAFISVAAVPVVILSVVAVENDAAFAVKLLLQLQLSRLLQLQLPMLLQSQLTMMLTLHFSIMSQKSRTYRFASFCY